MNVPLTRRSPGCVSDLTIDRWLLGETPGSDEARRLEHHMASCAVCASRLGSLRTLYGNAPSAGTTTSVQLLEAAPTARPGESGVLQVIVLRDGLLVGTEYFTPGRWTVGSSPTCDLVLSDGPAPRHAALVFHDGTVALEAREAAVFVNGVRLQRGAVRPIDEVLVGPYVLRVRLITERWSWPAMVAAPPLDERATVVDARPGLRDTQLQATLFWGDRQLGSTVVTERLSPGVLEALGFEGAVDARREPSGAWRLALPTGALTLALSEATSVRHGALTLLLTVQPVVASVPRAPVLADRRFAAILSMALLVSTAAALSVPEREDDDGLDRRPLPVVRIHVTPPVKPTPPKPQPPTEAPPAPTTPARRPPKLSSGPTHSSPKPPKNRFEALERIISSSTTAVSALTNAGAKQRGATLPLTALGPGLGKPASGLGLNVLGDTSLGIGRRGLAQAGQLRAGGIGSGKIGGLVSGAKPTGLTSGRGSTGRLDKDAIAKVINEHLSEVQRCYEHSLLSTGAGGGRLQLEWNIGTSGAVTGARVMSSSLAQRDVPQCVLSALKRWVFPKPIGGSVVVSYPFQFQSSSF